MKGFRDFILRGNVVDLAVAVVIGAAFGTVVAAFVKDLITPLIAAIGGQPDFSNISFTINNSKHSRPNGPISKPRWIPGGAWATCGPNMITAGLLCEPGCWLLPFKLCTAGRFRRFNSSSLAFFPAYFPLDRIFLHFNRASGSELPC